MRINTQQKALKPQASKQQSSPLLQQPTNQDIAKLAVESGPLLEDEDEPDPGPCQVETKRHQRTSVAA